MDFEETLAQANTDPSLPAEASQRLWLFRDEDGDWAFAEGPALLDGEVFRKARLDSSRVLQFDLLFLRDIRFGLASPRCGSRWISFRLAPVRGGLRRSRWLKSLAAAAVAALATILAFTLRPAAHRELQKPRPAQHGSASSSEVDPLVVQPIPSGSSRERLEAARAAFALAKDRLANRDVAPENRAEAWRALERAARLVEGEDAPGLRDEVEATQVELEAEFDILCGRAFVASQRAEEFGQRDAARSELRGALRFMPSIGHACRGKILDRLRALGE